MVGSQHTIMYVALEAESNTISPNEMNRSEGTFLNFYVLCRAQTIRITPTLLATFGFEITRGLLISYVLENISKNTRIYFHIFSERKPI